jgi:hypothetical protein
MAGRLAASVLLVWLLGAGVSSASPLRPDLVVTRVSVVQQGGSLRVTDVVANRGRTPAPPTSGSYDLGGVRLGGRSIGRLQPGSNSRGSKRLTIPQSLAPGPYRLRVCADDRGRINEANERNNCRFATQPVRVADRRPPRFAGLERATTCIPGPAGGALRESRYALQWEPAVDDMTPASELVYDIYQATVPGGEDMSAPTYTSPPGATSFTTPLLPDDASYYFVVRARDTAGNRDANRVERLGMNLCV